MSQLQGNEARRLSRRTIATGAAWAVPVIAVGAAAPAMAASPNEPPVFELVPGSSCKYPGNSFGGTFKHGYNLVFNVTAPTTGVLCITGITVPNGLAKVVLVDSVDGNGDLQCTTIPQGTSQIRIVVVSENSANGSGTFTGTFNNVTGTFSALFSNFNPCSRSDPAAP